MEWKRSGEDASRLLIVEDDPAVRRSLARGLRSAGLCAVFASTLTEGIEKLDGCDVALVDLDLPDGLGTQLLRAVRRGSRPIRVAIFSGKPDADQIVAASGERPDAMFRKPANLDDLLAWIAGSATASPGLVRTPSPAPGQRPAPRIASDLAGNRTELSWGAIAPCEHLVEIYEDDAAFLDSLEGFVAGGIGAGEGVVVIATAPHLEALDQRLPALRGQYLACDAQATLDRFMRNAWPDDDLFNQVVTDVLARAGRGGRRVRAFGEMVALLWGQGHTGATVRLEQLWHTLCHQRRFSLFCAYPRIGFRQDADASIRAICAAHSRVVHAAG